jgi:hypothetical protein
MLRDSIVKGVARGDPAVVPDGEQTLPPERRKMGFKLLSEDFVAME